MGKGRGGETKKWTRDALVGVEIIGPMTVTLGSFASKQYQARKRNTERERERERERELSVHCRLHDFLNIFSSFFSLDCFPPSNQGAERHGLKRYYC